jgi:hypothetical protein
MSETSEVEQKESNTLKSEIKDLVLKWTQTTEIHGVSGITGAEHPFLMAFWLIACLTSTSYCLYMVVIAFKAYYQYDTLVSIVHQADQPADFPAVTFCNLNPIDEGNLFPSSAIETQVLQSIFSASEFACLLSYINFLHTSYLNGTNTYNLTQLELCLHSTSYWYIVFGLSNYLKRFVANTYNTSKTRQQFGFSLNDMLLVCEYNGEPCSTSDFVQFWHNDYGNCYTFNGGQNGSVVRQTNTAGPYYGLKLDLFVREFFCRGDNVPQLYNLKRIFLKFISRAT